MIIFIHNSCGARNKLSTSLAQFFCSLQRVSTQKRKRPLENVEEKFFRSCVRDEERSSCGFVTFNLIASQKKNIFYVFVDQKNNNKFSFGKCEEIIYSGIGRKVSR